MIVKYSSNFVVSFFSNKMVSETYVVKMVEMRNKPTFENKYTSDMWIMMRSIVTYMVSFLSNVHCAILKTPDLCNVVIAYYIGQCT